MSSRTAQALRGVGVGRLFVGALGLAMVSRDDVPMLAHLPPRAIAAARLLALRDLAEGAALVFTPENRVASAARIASTVDAVHAASMLALIFCSRRYRSAATLSAASALAWIAVAAVAAQPQSRLLRRSRIQR